MKNASDFKLEFLCVGFPKSGTSSLDVAMRENKEIYLPDNQKETFFIDWCDKCEDPMKEYQEKYFCNYCKSENKCIGAIEPSYYCKAEEVYRKLGKDIKIIILIREPVAATFSMFKMRLRKVHEKSFYKYYKDEKNNINKMFNRYINDFIKTKKDEIFFYDKWIKEYFKYYKKEQVKVVVFEEFITNPKKTMNEIQSFLEVKSVEYEKIPKTNEGKRISKNYFCAYINYILYKLEIKYRKRKPSKKALKLKEITKKINKHTLQKNKEKMSIELNKELRKIYKESIEETEKITGINLNNIWYQREDIDG